MSRGRMTDYWNKRGPVELPVRGKYARSAARSAVQVDVLNGGSRPRKREPQIWPLTPVESCPTLRWAVGRR